MSLRRYHRKQCRKAGSKIRDSGFNALRIQRDYIRDKFSKDELAVAASSGMRNFRSFIEMIMIGLGATRDQCRFWSTEEKVMFIRKGEDAHILARYFEH